MPRYFVPKTEKEGLVTLTGDDAKHIGFSLRMAPGEHISVCDLSKRESYDAEIVSITRDEVLCRLCEKLSSSGEPPYEVSLFQAMPKSDKLEWIIQKAVECGACEIRPFESSRC